MHGISSGQFNFRMPVNNFPIKLGNQDPQDIINEEHVMMTHQGEIANRDHPDLPLAARKKIAEQALEKEGYIIRKKK